MSVNMDYENNYFRCSSAYFGEIGPFIPGILRLLAFTFSFAFLSWVIFKFQGWNFYWLPLGLPSVLYLHYILVYLLLGPLIALFCRLLKEASLLYQKQSSHRATAVIKDFVGAFYSPSYFVLGIIAYLIVGIGLIGYHNLKPAIPLINGTLYDDILLQWDQKLFGMGILGELVGRYEYSVVTFLLDRVYFMMWTLAGMTLVALARKPVLFWRFTATWSLAYGLSMPISMLFPSIGPAFYQPELFSYIGGTYSVDVMAHLWDYYIAFQDDPQNFPIVRANGIVAMPSLHITIVFLSIFFLSKIVSRLKVVLWISLGLFVISTVYLGWHYLVDGLAGLLLGWVVLTISILWFPEKVSNEKETEETTSTQIAPLD